MNITRHFSTVMILLSCLLLFLGTGYATTGLTPALQQKVKSGEVPVPNFLQDEKPDPALFDYGNDELNLESSGRAVTGNYNVLALMVQFIDDSATTDSSAYDSLLFGNQLGNLKHYWSQASYGNLTILTVDMPSSTGWFTAAESLAYYVGTKNGKGSYPNNAQKLAEEVVQMADPFVDYSDYDNDGNGEVDALFIIHAGTGAEHTGSIADIVSHSWNLKNDLTLDGVTISDYTMEPEFWESPGDMTIGQFARHMAENIFGLPDLRDWDDSAGGLGDWSLMGTGYWNGPNSLGAYPALPDAWSRWQLGYSSPVVLASDTSLTIPAAEDSNVVYRVWTNGAQGAQYFLLENRQQTGYGSYLPGHGLLIYHVDESMTWNNRYRWYPGVTDFGHYQVALEQADGQWYLERAWDNGNSGDPFPGSDNNRNFNSTSTPGSKNYAGNDTYVSITNISESGGDIDADIALSHTFTWSGNALVWDADHTPLSGPMFQTLLQDSGFVVDYTDDILQIHPDSLYRYEYIFIALGMMPNTHAIINSESDMLANFLNLGAKKVYLEGGNAFRHDPQTAFHNMFKIGGYNSAKHDLLTVDGIDGTFCDSLTFTYGGEIRSVDRLLPESGSYAIFQNPDIPYFTTIVYNDQNYKTIGSSFEFGGLVDAASPSTKAELFDLLLKFYRDQLPKPAPRDLVAGSNFNGFVPLTWDPPASASRSRAVRLDSLVSYRVYRSQVSGGPYTMVADVSLEGRTYNDHEDYIDETVVNDSTYYYVLTANYSDTTESPVTHEVIATPAADSVMTQLLSYSGFVPTLDGVINASEWGDAVRVPIRSDSTLDSLFLYMKNDEDHLYLAVEDLNNIHDADDNTLEIFFDKDNNMTWDPTVNTSEGSFIIDYKNSDSVKVRYSPIYGSYPTNINFNTNTVWPAGVMANVSLASGHMQFEVSIDLQNSKLTAAMGDSIRLYVREFDGYTPVDYYYNDSGNWPFGAIWIAPQTYGQVVLGVKPPIPEIAVSPASVSRFVVGETSVSDTLWIKNVGQMKLGFSISDTTVTEAVSWLTETPLADSVAVGDSIPVTLTLNGAGLSTGVYNANILVASNDPYDSLLTVPVQMIKANAFIRTASLDKSGYKSGETISVSEELDTYLASQTVQVTTSLSDPLNQLITSQMRVVNLTDSLDDGFSELLSIPDTSATGTYSVKIIVTDTLSGILQDSAEFSISVTSFETWQLPVTVQNDTIQMVRYMAGSPTATSGYDSGMDISTAPPGSDFYSYFYISQVPNYLSTDFRQWVSPYSDVQSWDLRVVNTNGGSFTISWDPDSLPPQGNFTLTWNASRETFDMRTTSEVVLTGDGGMTVEYRQESTFDYVFANGGWHLISLPLIPTDNSLSALFPTAIMAFSYNNATGSYEAANTLDNGVGYWIAFGEATNVTISGAAFSSYTNAYTQGWHMIGAVNSATDFTNPDDTPDNSILASFGYNNETGSYSPVSSLQPGSGYWVAANNACDLTVAATARSASGSGVPLSETMKKRFEEFASTYGAVPPAPPAALNIGGEMQLIKEFSLFQNYPNPFNPVTAIKYYIDTPGRVSLEVFNILGQRVNTLVDQKQEIGLHELHWNATNSAGHKVPSGVYFYRLKSGDKVAIKKMMLLK